ncbi:MAG: hypothetical protein Q9212_002520 [Teloschistes hypoglaucus]
MDLQFTWVSGTDGVTCTITFINAQHHDLISQHRFVSNRRREILNCASDLQTYLDNVARSGTEAHWVRNLRNGERADAIRRHVAIIGGLIDNFREIALWLQEIEMRVGDEIVWAGLAPSA